MRRQNLRQRRRDVFAVLLPSRGGGVWDSVSFRHVTGSQFFRFRGVAPRPVRSLLTVVTHAVGLAVQT